MQFTRFIRKVFATKILLSGKFLLFVTLIPNSVKTVIPKPSKPCVTLQAICERCVYFAVQRIFPRRGSMTRSHPQPSPFGSVHVLQLGTIKQGFLLNISVKILDLTLVLICILQILKVKWSLNHTYGR